MTSIKSLSPSPDRAGRYTVLLDSGEKLRLYRQTVEDFGLYPGMELDEAAMNGLLTAAGQMSAKMRAVRIVSATNVSRRDLEQRLVRKGENPDQAKAAVDWMSDLNLVDDRKTAELIVARCIAKGYGLARAKQALYEKQVPREYWDEALTDYPDQDEKILDFLRAKLGPEPTDKDTKRAVDALLRRGHSWGAVRKALARLADETDDRED